MNIQSYTLRSYVRQEFNLTEEQLFEELNADKRQVILNRVFEKFANHRLYRNGLQNLLRTKDRFDNYTSFEHIETFDMLADDINITKQKATNKLDQWKRKLHLVKKERFEKRKQRKLRALKKQEYQQMWEPKNKLTMSRLERLKKLREEEQDKQYER